MAHYVGPANDLCAVCCSIVNTGQAMALPMEGTGRARMIGSMADVLSAWPTLRPRVHPGETLPMIANVTINGTRVCASHVSPNLTLELLAKR